MSTDPAFEQGNYSPSTNSHNSKEVNSSHNRVPEVLCLSKKASKLAKTDQIQPGLKLSESFEQDSGSSENFSNGDKGHCTVPELDLDCKSEEKENASERKTPPLNLGNTFRRQSSASTDKDSVIKAALSARAKKVPEPETIKHVDPPGPGADSATEQREKPPGFNMCFIVTFVVCLTVQFCAYGRLLRVPKENPKVGRKWDTRDDLKLPMSVPFTHIPSGDIAQLEKVISNHYMTVAVLYAPWSRPSQRVINHFIELAPNWEDADIAFVAMNCWVKGSLCNDNFNSWDFPQVLIYHKDIDHVPYIYSLSTFPAAFASELERLYEPVLHAETIAELTSILVKHQRSVIGLFSGHEKNEDYNEFLKAAIIHHFEYMDSYYVPFIVLSTRHVNVLEGAQLKTLVYKYTLFDTISPYQGRHHKLRHQELLKWLRVKVNKLPIRYLGHQGFNTMASDNVSVILASPLHQNTDNMINYMRSVLSYLNCNTEPEVKIHCKPNRTCLNPCQPDEVLTTNTILPCFFPKFGAPNYVQQCYFNKQRTSLIPSPFPPNTHRMSEDLTVLTQHTFLESEQMCSMSREDSCTQCTEIEQLHSDLEFLISRAASVHHSTHQGQGCQDNKITFYTLDTVIWADMATSFGVNRTDRQHTEALIKVDSQIEDVFTVDLTRKSIEDDDKFGKLLNGKKDETEKYRQDASGINERFYEDTLPEGSEVHADYVHEISKLDLLSIEVDKTLDYVVFAYTKWCGYCHIMRRKIEATARLLSSHASLSFVAIDIDKNYNLRGAKFSISKIPSVYVLPKSSDSPFLFSHEPHKPASVRDLVKFIKTHVTNVYVTKTTSYNARTVPPPLVPCATWTPAQAPPPRAAPEELNLAHSQTSPIDDMLERGEGSESKGPLQKKLEDMLGERPNKATDNFPNVVFDKMNPEEKHESEHETKCKSVLHLFKSLSIGSGVDPFHLNSITTILIRDIVVNKCLMLDYNCKTLDKRICGRDDIRDFWGWLGAACFRQSWEKQSCKYLLVASQLASMTDVVPEEIRLILEAKKHGLDVRSRDMIRRAKKLGFAIPNSLVDVSESFYLNHCYNWREEFSFYLRRTCSPTCTLACRVIYRFHNV